MRKSGWLTSGLSVVSGLSIGAVLMYLLDPESGLRRRRAAHDAGQAAWGSAGDALSASGDAVRSGLAHAAEHGADWKDRATNFGSSIWHHLAGAKNAAIGAGAAAGDYLLSARKAASRAAADVHDSAADGATNLGHRASKSAYRWLDRNAGKLGYSRPTMASRTGITLAGIGFLALGAGLMYVLDPASGRRRRADMRQRGAKIARTAGRKAYGRAHDAANRMYGAAHQAASAYPAVRDSVTDTFSSAKEAVLNKLHPSDGRAVDAQSPTQASV